MIEQKADSWQISGNTLGSSRVVIKQAVSWNRSIWEVARKIEEVADPRELSGNTLGSSHSPNEQALSGNHFYMAISENDQASGRPTGGLWEYHVELLERDRASVL